ncbi:MAG: HAMP domain-containing histidine kinase [Candidatus Omnitrophica bacterium]|nr:HAMP domain-containing histidine kinase [Candidatus Omnitrophota bacterium]
MHSQDKKVFILASIEEVSILRKFAILFLISSIIPMFLLYYIYLYKTRLGFMAMIMMVLGVFVGYFSIRSLLIKATDIARENRRAIEPFLSPQIIKEISQGENELVVLKHTFSALTKQLATTITELKNKNDELLALDQLKDDFVNNVSHEFRLPLSIIQESIRQITEGMFGQINEAQQKYLNMSLRNIDRLKTLIDIMLDISKIEKGKLELFKKNMDLRDVIKEVVSDLSQKIEKKGLKLKLELPAQPVEIVADRDKIIQVLINLVGNACKFTQQGSIEISARENEDSIECTVTDSGIGISSKDLPHLFSKFHQIAAPQEKGTGLGLVIAKHIIELHHGQIYVESQEKIGTKFTFTLPKNTAAPNGKAVDNEKNINRG